MDIGFIGLGNMGAHMARRLVEAGHKVIVYDTRQEAIGDIAALGGIAARSPKEVADLAETDQAAHLTRAAYVRSARENDSASSTESSSRSPICGLGT